MMSSATDSSHKIDMESEEINIDMPQDKEPPIPWPSECCIYKVPKRLRKVKPEAYTPKLISIGPIHRGNSELDMERRKQTYCDKFFLRTKKAKEEFESFIEKNKDQICNCYEEEITLPCGKEFVNMILLDSIFIIELFRMTAKKRLEDKLSKLRLEDEENKNDYILSKLWLENILSKLRLEDEENKNDYILSKPWLDEGIMHDLRLLENQLPLFILDGLYSRGGDKGFITLACIYFFGVPCNLEELSSEMKDVKHFTDLYRTFYRPLRSEIRDRFQDSFQHLYSATVLQNTAGLIFEKNKETQFEEYRGLLDIHLKSSCLQTRLVVPPFVVQDGTEELFRNLMALEQCHYPFKAYICNYIVLLDCLINSKEDVELLVDKRIIVNLLGSSEEVAHMVNDLCHEIIETSSCYRHVADDLNKLYDSHWKKNMAPLRNVYFRDIWRGTATVAGILALFFTFWSFLRTFVSIP